MLVDTCDQIVGEYVVRTPHAGARVDRSVEAWRTVVQVGLPTLCLDEELGGSGANLLDLALVVERLAQGPLAVPLLGTALASSLLASVSSDPDERAARGLDALVAGRPGSILLSPALDALSGADGSLAFDWVEDALSVGLAGGQIVSATARAVDAEGGCVDLTRRIGIEPNGGETIGPIDDDRVRRFETEALVLLCADLVGAMAGALDAAVAHAIEREQFGRPIGSFQAVQQLCADQLVTISAARSITRSAAEAFDEKPLDDALHQARVAKAYCSENAVSVCEAAIQVWGGIGMTWECPAHLFLRRVLLSSRVLGDESAQLEALVDQHLFADSGRP